MTSTCNADSIIVSGNKSAALKQLIKNSGSNPVYVFFFSPTCPHCHTLNDAFQKYRSQCQAQKAKATLIIVNLQRSPELFQEYKVKSFPQVMVYRNGKKIKHIIGADLPALAEAFRLANISL
jgi:thioredoxin-like negative regulator of GroEL